MNYSSYTLNFDQYNCKVWSRTVVKCEKSSPAKFANFVYIRITRKSFNNLSVKSWFFPARSTKIYKICKHLSPRSHSFIYDSQTY